MAMEKMITLGLLLIWVILADCGKVYHVNGRRSLSLTYLQAHESCNKYGAMLAMREDLNAARKTGYSKCACGWTMDKTVLYTMNVSASNCGNRAGVHDCDMGSRERWDSFCYAGGSLNNCSKPLGMELGGIRNSQLAASSERRTWWPIFTSSRWTAQIARLHNKNYVNAWMPASNGRNQWIQVDLERPTAVTGIITQGAKRLTRKSWVSAYTVKYSKDGHNFKTINENNEIKIFTGNNDNDGLVRNMFPRPVLTRFIRIHPYNWHRHITMRFELLGCDMEIYDLAVSRIENGLH